MYHLADAYWLTVLITALAAYLGALVFSAAAVPGLVVTRLDESAAAVLLRAFWPLYHRFAAIAGTGLTLLLAWRVTGSPLPDLYALLLVALAGGMTTCFFVGGTLIDSINRARDADDGATFDRLHRIDVALVGLGVILGVVLLTAAIYVLPGQFTFWQTA
ncbi:MAG: hypothetical protein AAF515_06455 [Pseudomonadota bacterium]